MALIKCPECGKEISDKSKACIHCGYPLESQAKHVDKYEVILISVEHGTPNLNTVKLLLDMGYNFDTAKHIVENAPQIVESNVTYEKALDMKRNLSIAGADAEIKLMDGEPICIETIERAPLQLFCPRCKSTQVTTGARGFSLVTGFIGSSKTVNRCGKCGYKWTPKL